MDKSWINKPLWSSEYRNGVNDFLNFAFRNPSFGDILPCPCNDCMNCSLRTRDIMQQHLLHKGFLCGYTKWLCHGESSTSFEDPNPPRTEPEMQTSEVDGRRNDDMHELFQAAFGFQSFPSIDESIEEQQDGGTSSDVHCETDAGAPNVQASGSAMPNRQASGAAAATSEFCKLVDEARTELYKGCKSFSRLSFMVRLFHLKCLSGWSGKSFTMLLQLLNVAFPDIKLPDSFQKVKRLLKSFGLSYEKIGVCPNECMLYWGERKEQQICHVCGVSKWKKEPNNGQKGELARILRYFPLIPRLQRLFMSRKTSSDMRWHRDGRKKDGFMRHPSDSAAWAKLDELYPDFAEEFRNIRLGLASDGFNPYRMLSSTYSIWPVVLIPYNLPPDLCTKQASLILSMIIPGPKSPGNKIDVYLQPLIEELKTLWVGVETFDSNTQETFNMRAALLWTVNDYPAMAVLSGRSTKGRFACPYCGENTCSEWLHNGKKFCYMGHRKWLDPTHRFRQQASEFDGSEEHDVAPTPLSGSDIKKYLEKRKFSCEATSRRGASSSKRRRNEQVPESVDEEGEDYLDREAWKKKSIFYELPYWEFLLIRHMIDFMHTEKNVAENCVATLLNEKGKSKDNMNARLDLVRMGIREGLHPYVENGKTKTRPACFSMTTKEKDLFLKVFKDLKVPDGYASNISKSVNFKEHRLQGLKSHDYHVLMQDLLPVALKFSLSKQVTTVIIELCSLMKALCSKTLQLDEMEKLQQRAALTLCSLEKIFPPSFFTIMVHLVIHLPEEVKLAGPVHYRWMYPIERYLLTLKKYVENGNRAQPEASIAEGYLAEECATFCSKFIEGVETRTDRPLRNPDLDEDLSMYLFNTGGKPVGAIKYIALDEKTWVQAHRYVLFHHEAVGEYCANFLREVKKAYRPRRYKSEELDKIMNENFHSWFQDRVAITEQDVSDEIKWLAKGPLVQGKSYRGMIYNGTRYLTKSSEIHKKTQNSGMLVTSKTRTYSQGRNDSEEEDTDYYGILTDIIELDYHSKFKVVLFRGDWADPREGVGTKTDDLGFKLVNFTRLIHTGKELVHEPFVFSSQVQQVFYVQDPGNIQWHAAIRTRPRSCIALGEEYEDDDYDRCVPFAPQQLDDIELDRYFQLNCARTDVTEDIELDN